MTKGHALAIGLNSVDPNHYSGWSGELLACEADARDMAAIAESRGFDVQRLLTKEATRRSVTKQIEDAAKILKAGDIFMLSYSGHGGQLPDLNDEEPDALDETWCLFDGELVDDEIYAALLKFPEGVRVLMFSDSCHSGTVAKVSIVADFSGSPVGPVGSETRPRFRMMPAEVALRTYRANRQQYDAILKNQQIREARNNLKASVLLVSGCQDNQLSLDGTFNGLFTANLLRVWNEGKFKGNYRKFHKSIVRRMPPTQTPNFFWASRVDRDFEAQPPFTIERGTG